MKGDRIPYSDTISRYCSPTRISELTGMPTKQAFLLRNSELRSENPYLSINWMEYFENIDRQNQIEQLKLSFKKKEFKIKNKSKFALYNVGEIISTLKKESYDINILHWPSDKDPSHSGVFDIESDNDMIAAILSQIDCELISGK